MSAFLASIYILEPAIYSCGFSVFSFILSKTEAYNCTNFFNTTELKKNAHDKNAHHYSVGPT